MSQSESTGRGDASFHVISQRKGVGETLTDVTYLLNEYDSASREGDLAKMHRLAAIIPEAIKLYEEVEIREHGNPDWIRPVLWAGWHHAKGDFPAAIQEGKAGWEAAHSEHQAGGEAIIRTRKAISASNLADAFRRLGKIDEAISWGQRSVELWPENPINLLVLGMALARVNRSAAEVVFERLLSIVVAATDKRDALATCIRYEDELAQLRHIKAVESLLQRVRE